MGSVLEEEDIVRLYMGWDDMVQAIKKKVNDLNTHHGVISTIG